MTIAKMQYEAIGAHTYTPEGPYGAAGQTPLPSQAFGVVVDGDAGSEFIFVQYAPTTTVTFNQGDFFFWDNNFFAFPVVSGAAVNATPVGTGMGALYLNGRVGDPASSATVTTPTVGPVGNTWSYTFAAGNLYGIWLQRAGTSLGNFSVVTTQSATPSTTATAGSLATPTASTHFSSFTVGTVSWQKTSITATASAVSGSTQLTTIVPALGTAITQIAKGMYASGTSVPNGAYVVDVNGTNGSITLSAAVTGTISAGTITFSNNVAWGSVTNGSNLITGVASIPGVYPNQTITGTNIPGSTTITAISGLPGNYTIVMSANATGTSGPQSNATTGYYETMLSWPTVSSST